MIRLIGAETHRWVARRGLWVALLGLLAILATMCWSIVVATRPPEAAVVAQGKIAYAEQHAYWVENHEQEEAFCRASDPEAPADVCAQPEPQPEWFYPQPMTWEAATSTATVGAGATAGLFLILMAASFWGAEFRSGSLATWLTFVPSRPRVWASKMVVVALAGAVVSAVVLLVGLLTAWGAVAAHQGADAVGSWVGPLQAAGRGVLFGAMMALVGAGLAVVFRSTVAAVAVPLAYLFAQGMLGILMAIPGFDRLTGLLPENNVQAFLLGSYTYSVPVQRMTPQGMETEWLERTISLGQGTVYLLVAVALACVVSLAVFRRRDVTE